MNSSFAAAAASSSGTPAPVMRFLRYHWHSVEMRRNSGTCETSLPFLPRKRPVAETFGPLKLVRRASSNRSKRTDREVLAALDLIRREACNGLRARDVFVSFSCTRRMAEIRFRAATGKSPLEAIQEIRRAKAEELLRDPTRDRNAVANLCGYSSANALANFLRRDKPKGQNGGDKTGTVHL